MTVDEPAMWQLIPAHKRERVLCIAKAMCSSREADDEEGDDPYCATCDKPGQGTCMAFGLWGQMALNVSEALDTFDRQSVKRDG